MSCVEEDVQGVVMATEEWKCLYAPKTDVLQPCNTFGCPSWLAQDWSPVGAFSLFTGPLSPLREGGPSVARQSCLVRCSVSGSGAEAQGDLVVLINLFNQNCWF